VAAATPDGTAPAPTRLPPAGIVIGVGMVLWGIERFLDEHLWLGEDGHLGSLLVQGAGIILAVAGTILLITRIRPLQRWRRGEGGEPAPGPPSASVDGSGTELEPGHESAGQAGPAGDEAEDAAVAVVAAEETQPGDSARVASATGGAGTSDGD
jgi:hypothetical protein